MLIEVTSAAINYQPSTLNLPSPMKPKLLIVDDDEEIRTQMKWALGQDYEVLLAGERAEALETFSSNRPAVTILDLGLPPRPNEPDEGLAALSGLLALDRNARRSSSSPDSQRKKTRCERSALGLMISYASQSRSRN